MNLLHWPRRLQAGLRNRLHRLWMRHHGHGMEPDALRREFESIYRNPDPWKMDSPREQFRFAETSRILREHLIGPSGRVGSLLEIGSGEGHQSLHLRRLCDRLTGIELVGQAVERARARVPDAEFIVGELRAQPWVDERERYDIITACEVLQAFADIPGALSIMSRLGRACLVTYHAPDAALMERQLSKIAGARRHNFRFENTVWHACWWRNAASRADA
jgi:SAM-dependent methyltransferase